MKIFVTGGSGFIGSKVVEILISKGHSVIGLARSDASAEKLEAAGAEVVRGELTEIDLLIKTAAEADGTIHLGFLHDFTRFAYCMEMDQKIVTAICESYKGTNKFFINSTGTLGLQGPDLTDEDSPVPPPLLPGFSIRGETEKKLLAYAKEGVRVVSIRLSPTVHDVDCKGLIPSFYGMFKKAGAAYYPDAGDNVWPFVHRDDAAELYTLAVDKAAAGTVLHAIAEPGVSTKEIAEAMAKKGGLEAKSIPKAQLFEILGPLFGALYSANNHVSSEKTKKLTGWVPTGATFLEDFAASTTY
ncbi:hypothetical protein PSN45_000580 [Yamadazyma tenuis]|uniref:Putative polysaccharide synthesis protein n=1 Tax=Candida tenuis (strain ATCC 10573 / BCRC 21748 / CBS 615 / JCM 9827 / NBRC 10315 / NRRL Y-1498 / VKM Y-70) TaxID=590646 RepID=G3B9H3_CANTC|nr:putative polysaccharide synthesis protein [Yamadazyma tenuis ATCC 10573]XP_006688865.1 uncharacterized protein CANTEDRAFT_115335 [Yamadazyma tenuis ATCC 10573]EGV62694.1 putative polysaccharide synthesis protein [Yamadazyma tenuis ATCC 10573]EGV62695.1 hypothetical protein CANTEDRAFT_115335 [Yamadazyma tenuis ATCC 10573]WEJ93119.1 hypothetical protein PSN45_000580 [Yamadazyma tenuis]